jgi:hypothetical protein
MNDSANLPSPNYITDITTKWLGSKCYFVSIYACPSPNAISPTIETKFARMEYRSVPWPWYPRRP